MDWPNIYDWDTDEEYREAGERLKRHLRDDERIKSDPTFQDPADQEAIARAIKDTEQQLQMWATSRARRRDFRHRGVVSVAGASVAQLWPGWSDPYFATR